MKNRSSWPFLAVLLVFLISASVYSTPEVPLKGIIRGNIIDAFSGEPVAYANVLLYNIADSNFIRGTTSDSVGSYTIEKVNSGNYYLVFTFIGYKSLILRDITISATEMEKNLPLIKLERTAAELEVVNISDDKNTVTFKIDKKVINVEQNLNATTGSASDVLQNTPGVTVDADGNVLLRGSSNYTVLIDGKPRAISGADLLKQIPASTIKDIEIITNPSAKYDAEGTSGILNIILKKQIKQGVNGIINTSAGTWNKYTGDAQFNIKAKKFNIFMGGLLRYQPNVASEDHKQWNIVADTIYDLHGYGPSMQTVQHYAGKGGVDYNPDDKNSLSVYAEYGRFCWKKAEDNKYRVALSDDQYYTLDFQRINIVRDYLVGTFDYTHKFRSDEHKISLALQYTTRDGSTLSNYDDYFSNADWQNLGINSLDRNNAISKASLYQANIDYVNAFTEKRIIEAGLQAKVRPIATTALYEKYDSTLQSWLGDTTYTNKYNFHNDNYEAYITYSDSYLGFDLKAGLRLEYTDRMLDQLTKNKKFSFEQLDYFPSFYISRTFKNDHQLQFSYSRRINHPQEWAINPYPIFNNKYAYGTGNPYLKPEYANAFELNYLKMFKIGSLSAGVFYRATKNIIDQLWKVDENGKTIIISENLNRDRNIGAEADVNLSPAKWLSLNMGGSFYHYNLMGNANGEDFSNQSYNYDLRFTSTFRVHKFTRMQLNFIYNGPSVTSQGTMSAFYGLNFTLKQEFFKQRFAVTVNVQDILNSMKYKFVTNTPNYHAVLAGDYQSPIVIVNLIYKINNFVRKNRPTETMDIGG